MWLVIAFVVLLQTGPIHTVCANCRPGYCSQTRCTVCNDGYYLYLYSCYQCLRVCATCSRGDRCSSCRSGYSFINNWCMECPENCEQCTKYDSCNSCNTGYYLQQKECRKCSENCATCTKSDSCNSCNTGYYLQQKECRKCSENCATCSTSATPCSTCRAGYYGDECAARCSDGCYNLICHKTSGDCQNGCKTGYYGTKCHRCPSKCQTCTSSTSCTSCNAGYFGSECDPCPSYCLQSPDTSSKCWPHNGTCTDGCIQGFTGPNCTDDAISRDKQHGFDVLLYGVIPALCLLIVILLAIVGGCAATKRRNRNDPQRQGALYITAKSESIPIDTYAQVYSAGDQTDTPTEGALYITAKSDSILSNAYALAHSAVDPMNAPTRQSGMAILALRTRAVHTSGSDREPSRLYASIDETNTEAGAPCEQDQHPRLLYSGVGALSERGDRLPSPHYPSPPTSLPGRGTICSGRIARQQTCILPDVPTKSSGPPDRHSESSVAGASSEDEPVYWLPDGEYEPLRARQKTRDTRAHTDTYTSLQQSVTASIPDIERQSKALPLQDVASDPSVSDHDRCEVGGHL